MVATCVTSEKVISFVIKLKALGIEARSSPQAAAQAAPTCVGLILPIDEPALTIRYVFAFYHQRRYHLEVCLSRSMRAILGQISSPW